MLAFVIFDLVLSCCVIVVSPCCRRWHNDLNEPLDPFPLLVAAERKGGLGLGYCIAGLPLLGRDSSPLLTYRL